MAASPAEPQAAQVEAVDAGPAPTPKPIPEPRSPAVYAAPSDFTDFIVGYRNFGGRPEWEERFVTTLRCEGSRWDGYHGGNFYWTRAQFSLDTYAKVVAYFASLGIEFDPDDPYLTGAAVAWWSKRISHPGDRSGWPTCWWR